jgi:hypothetical protein
MNLKGPGKVMKQSALSFETLGVKNNVAEDAERMEKPSGKAGRHVKLESSPSGIIIKDRLIFNLSQYFSCQG